MYYNNLDLAGFSINTDGYRIFVKDTLLMNTGIIQNNGASATVVSTVGATGAPQGSIGGGTQGGHRIDGSNTPVAGGAFPGLPGIAGINSLGGAGGAGGNADTVQFGPVVGGSGGPLTALSTNDGGTLLFNSVVSAILGRSLSGFITTGGSGGGSGAVSRQFSSGLSGAGGGAGGVVIVAAKLVVGPGTFSAIGGNGGNAGGGTFALGAAGGGAGGGGIIVVVTNTPKPIPGIVTQVNGGTGGTPVVGGAGASATSGLIGSSGQVVIL